jgi:hypothetical protein
VLQSDGGRQLRQQGVGRNVRRGREEERAEGLHNAVRRAKLLQGVQLLPHGGLQLGQILRHLDSHTAVRLYGNWTLNLKFCLALLHSPTGHGMWMYDGY